MKYGGIPKKFLDAVLGETYTNGNYTLRDELEQVGEDIISYNIRTYSRESNKSCAGQLQFFMAWTKHYVMVMVDGPFGDREIIALPRNPPKKAKGTK